MNDNILQTTAQKLQRILETKTGFKDLITEKGGVITETTTFHEYIDEARKLMEGGKVVVEEASATAVPNEGHVDKIYFNTNLTPEEVDQIITDANLEWYESEGQGKTYPIYLTDTGEGLMIMKMPASDDIYVIASSTYMAYASVGSRELGLVNFEGWYFEEGVGIPQNGEIALTGNLLLEDPEDSNTKIGLQNEALKQIISSTPFDGEPFYKELTGTYEAITADITENGEVDLTTYWDNGEMPIKVNVNIEAGASGEAIEIATEEELDAAMVEENLGKFYKFTGETTVKYEKDAIYVVQDTEDPIIKKEEDTLTKFITLKTCHHLFEDAGREYTHTYDNSSVIATTNYIDIGKILKPSMTSECKEFSRMFYNARVTNVPIFDTSNAENCYRMFYNTTTDTFIDLNLFNFKKVKYARYMFENCYNPNYDLIINMPILYGADYMFRNSTFKSIIVKPTDSSNFVCMFEDCKAESIEAHLKDGLSSGTVNCRKLFYGCEKAHTIKLTMGYSFADAKLNDCHSMFYNNYKLVNLQLNIGKHTITPITSRSVQMFGYCQKLETVPPLDFKENKDASSMFVGCKMLKNIDIKNIKINLQIGSGTSWGHLLTLDSLVNTCKECINVGAARTLTVGTANLEKLAAVYVKLTNEPEEDETLPKLPCEICESTDEGAMLISDYLALKNWTLA